jgi:hypothetical protein
VRFALRLRRTKAVPVELERRERVLGAAMGEEAAEDAGVEGESVELGELRCRICVLLRRSCGRVRRFSSGVEERDVGAVSMVGMETARVGPEGRDLWPLVDNVGLVPHLA